jgi:MarR family transcriptional regulator for hemolysin
MASSSLRSGFGPLVSQTQRQWRRAVDRRLQPFGLTEATWLPLLRISRAPAPMRQKDLAASLGLDGSSVVRLLDALEQAGLVERREEAKDRRAKTLHLTAAGRATVGRVEAASRAVRERLLSGLSDAELDAAAAVLRHICAVLAELEELPA